jgi:GNAT superfamily N-acetyltransferase
LVRTGCAFGDSLDANRHRSGAVAQSSPDVIDGHVAVQNGREVTRLFVAPAARRLKIGSALLDHVSVWAGGRLILNVIDKPDSPAVAFYEASGSCALM